MLRAFLIESQSTVRNHLKQTLHASSSFGGFGFASTLEEGIRTLAATLDEFDVVFVAANFGETSVSDFIHAAKETRACSDTAFILIFHAEDSNVPKLATNLLQGSDSFLLTPFSVTAVADVAEIAMEVKRRNADQRLSAASGLIVDSMMDEVDRRARLKAAGKKVPPVSKALKQASGQFKIVAGESLKTFYDTAIDRFSARVRNVEAQHQGKKGYDGASERLRQKYGGEDDPEENS